MLVLGKIDITPLKKAFARLESALVEAKSDLEKAGAIQCFEYNFELAWKMVRKTLIALGRDVLPNPRTTFREAAANALIDDPETWFKFIDFRNQTSHTYNEAVAEEIFAMLPSFRDNLKEVIQRLEALQR